MNKQQQENAIIQVFIAKNPNAVSMGKLSAKKSKEKFGDKYGSEMQRRALKRKYKKAR